MVGLERTVVPLVGTNVFGITSEMVVLSFIVAFGLVKAFANLGSGLLADRYTRKSILVAGWLLGLPVPFVLAYAPDWGWIVAANVLLGASQGLTWSMAVNMKIDLVGPHRRGLALGINEAAGYGAVGLTALMTGYIAAETGLRPEPFYVGIVYAVLGLALSTLVVRDTSDHAREEIRAHGRDGPQDDAIPGTRWIVAETSWRNRTLFGSCQAGLVNNLNDGMSWGIFPLLFAASGLAVADIGFIKAIYPVIWGAGQLVTGPLSDHIGRKGLIVAGMLVQAGGHVVIGFGLTRPFLAGVVGSALLGIGTAMVYPTLLAAVSDTAEPVWRASSVGVYRFWRDAGYAVGALIAGSVAAVLTLRWAVHTAGLLTLASGLIAWWTMEETLKRPTTTRADSRHDDH
ncbi:MAG: MFS transporter [Actinobacteria bacterium]|nr:MFS transporter [Actinomycetota bacterium]